MKIHIILKNKQEEQFPQFIFTEFVISGLISLILPKYMTA